MKDELWEGHKEAAWSSEWEVVMAMVCRIREWRNDGVGDGIAGMLRQARRGCRVACEGDAMRLERGNTWGGWTRAGGEQRINGGRDWCA